MPSFMTLRLQTQQIRGNQLRDRQTDKQTDRPPTGYIYIDFQDAMTNSFRKKMTII